MNYEGIPSTTFVSSDGGLGYEFTISRNAFAIRSNYGEPTENHLKRVFACLGVFLMPAEGLDEHIESTVERCSYYESLAKLKPPVVRKPAWITTKIDSVVPRPDLIISE